jgi:hypothetical protein
MSLPIVNAGLAIMAKRLITQAGESGSAQPEPKYLAWGTGTTAAALSNTALQTPSAEARTAGTTPTVTTNVANDTYQCVGTIVSLSGQTISELGQFDASASGNMLARWVFPGLPLLTGDSITFTTQIYGT